jgi:hypothetical protein
LLRTSNRNSGVSHRTDHSDILLRSSRLEGEAETERVGVLAVSAVFARRAILARFAWSSVLTVDSILAIEAVLSVDAVFAVQAILAIDAVFAGSTLTARRLK